MQLLTSSGTGSPDPAAQSTSVPPNAKCLNWVATWLLRLPPTLVFDPARFTCPNAGSKPCTGAKTRSAALIGAFNASGIGLAQGRSSSVERVLNIGSGTFGCSAFSKNR